MEYQVSTTQNLSEKDKILILLCSFVKNDETMEPLSSSEYRDLSYCLNSLNIPLNELRVESNLKAVVLRTNLDEIRLQRLLGRKYQLEGSLIRWNKQGIWVVTEQENAKDKFLDISKTNLPPLFFGIGNKDLLKRSGLAIVGSRNVDQEGAQFTHDLGDMCVANKTTVVSGCARGVDSIAMKASFSKGNPTVGIVADSLLEKSKIWEYQKSLHNGNLLLISAQCPDKGFTVASAMQRNKYIYAMANNSLVVSADHLKGGTWAGAIEELKRPDGIPVMVRTGSNIPKGNQKLLELGAVAWSNDTHAENFKAQLEELSSAYYAKKNQALPARKNFLTSLF